MAQIQDFSYVKYTFLTVYPELLLKTSMIFSPFDSAIE